MSNDINLTVRNSDYINRNLVILANSDVKNENLILNDGINYVKRFEPDIMKENNTMNCLYDIQKQEISELNSAIDIVINNTFFESLNYYGIIKWEKVLQLESKSDVDLNVRRELLLTKRRFRPPFTRQNMMKTLVSIWGEGNFTFEIFPNIYEIIIDIHTNSPEVYLKFQTYVRNLIPANLYVIFSIQYTYLYLYRYYNYNNLSTFTYEELGRYSSN